MQDFVIPGRPATPFYLFASRLLSICANSATCERLFSVFGTTLTKLRNRMGTSTLTSLAELKMHIRSEHQERSTKVRMKRLFGRRSGGSFPGTTPVPQPTPTGPNYEPAITFSETPPLSEMSASGLRHLIPDDSMDGEPDFAGTENPISLRDLFDFNDDGWVNIYDGYARKRCRTWGWPSINYRCFHHISYQL